MTQLEKEIYDHIRVIAEKVHPSFMVPVSDVDILFRRREELVKQLMKVIHNSER